MNLARSIALVATLLLSSASVSVATGVNASTDSGQKLSTEVNQRCWPGNPYC